MPVNFIVSSSPSLKLALPARNAIVPSVVVRSLSCLNHRRIFRLDLLIKEKVHRDKIYNKRKREEFEQLDVPEAINQINRRLEKIEKRENPRDTIVSFFRTQEREILKPMSDKIESISATLQEVLDAINNIN